MSLICVLVIFNFLGRRGEQQSIPEMVMKITSLLLFLWHKWLVFYNTLLDTKFIGAAVAVELE